MALQAGARFGAYVIVRPLGRGGMGEVYEARDTRPLRSVHRPSSKLWRGGCSSIADAPGVQGVQADLGWQAYRDALR